MTKITTIDKKTCGLVASQLAEELQDYANEHDVTIKRGNAKFSPEGWMEVTIRVSIKGEGGIPVTKEAAAFKQMAHFYGLKAEDLGREFTIRGNTYILVGLNPSAPKWPFIATGKADGKSYKFQEAAIKSLLGSKDGAE